MKRAIISIVMLILLIMVYTNVMSALGSISNVLNGITDPPSKTRTSSSTASMWGGKTTCPS